jgi:hypothetical protein
MTTLTIYMQMKVKQVQELTGLRILEIHGTCELGVPVPARCDGVSTPLYADKTLGLRVRRWRKERRRHGGISERQIMIHDADEAEVRPGTLGNFARKHMT